MAEVYNVLSSEREFMEHLFIAISDEKHFQIGYV